MVNPEYLKVSGLDCSTAGRLLSERLRVERSEHHFPCLVIRGPVGSGKTHLLRSLFVDLRNEGERVLWIEAGASPRDVFERLGIEIKEFKNLERRLRKQWSEFRKTVPESIFVLVDEFDLWDSSHRANRKQTAEEVCLKLMMKDSRIFFVGTAGISFRLAKADSESEVVERQVDRILDLDGMKEPDLRNVWEWWLGREGTKAEYQFLREWLMVESDGNPGVVSQMASLVGANEFTGFLDTGMAALASVGERWRLKVMAHCSPQQREILRRIALAYFENRKVSVGELVQETGIAQSIVSNALKRMKENGVVVEEREGRKVYYTIREKMGNYGIVSKVSVKKKFSGNPCHSS